jgi:LysR family transcriptional regulator for metE and metH
LFCYDRCVSRIHAIPKPALDVRDLELVVAVAAGGSTVRAASSLHLTQSAVSRGLLLAEEKLGLRIFDRSARGLAPTAAGKTLIEGAGAVLAQLVELEARVRDGGAASPPLRLVCECYTAYRWLPSTLARLQRDDVRVDLSIDHTREPVAALVNGEIDVALLTTATVPARARARFEERPLFTDEIVFLVAEDHPLARRASLDVRDLTAYPLILSSQTPAPERAWFFGRAFGKKPPPSPHAPIRLPLTEAIIDAARAGMGIAILSEWIASPYLEGRSGLVAKRLHGEPIARPWRIAFRKDLGDAPLRLAAAIEHAPPKVYMIRAGKRDATPSAR